MNRLIEYQHSLTHTKKYIHTHTHTYTQIHAHANEKCVKLIKLTISILTSINLIENLSMYNIEEAWAYFKSVIEPIPEKYITKTKSVQSNMKSDPDTLSLLKNLRLLKINLEKRRAWSKFRRSNRIFYLISYKQKRN